MREYTSGPACREAHDRGVVDALRELLHSDLLDADGALSVLSAVVLDADGDVAADFAIDLQATQAHAGIDQPDWATPWGNYVDAHAFVPNTFDPRFCAVDDCGVRRDLHPDAKCVLCGLDLDGATDAAVIRQGWLCPDCFDAHDANPPANDNPGCDVCGAVVPCAHYGKAPDCDSCGRPLSTFDPTCHTTDEA